jgi:hypothetical protein
VDPARRVECLAVAEHDARAFEREAMPWTAPMATLARAGIARLRGEDARAVQLLERAAVEADSAKLGLFAAGARHALGQCMGGDEGARLVAAALESLEKQGAKDPGRLVVTVAPGFEKA